MAQIVATASFAGSNNALQIGQNFGVVQYYEAGYQGQDADQEYRGNYFHVDRTTTSYFVSREKYRTAIAQQLGGAADSREHKLLVISGLGGAGKSQLALDYLQTYRHRYTATFWVEASSPASLKRDFTQIFSLLFPAEQPPADLDTQLARTKARLQGTSGCRLIIFDGADTIDESQKDQEDFVDLKRFLPRLPGVHVVLTTRLSVARWISNLHPVQIDAMEEHEALALFRRCSQVSNQGDLVRAIVDELGHFPLAIVLAGFYIASDLELKIDLKLYLDEYRDRRDEILASCPNKLVHEYGKTVLLAWETSYNALNSISQLPPPVRLLTCLSFLHREDFNLDLFRIHGLSNVSGKRSEDVLAPWAKAFASSPKVTVRGIKEAFAKLADYCLVNTAGSTYSMHKIVHEWGIDRLKQSEREEYSLLTAQALQATIEVSKLDWQTRLRLIPHIEANFGALKKTFGVLNKMQLDSLNGLKVFESVLIESQHLSQLPLLQKYIYESYQSSSGPKDVKTIISMLRLGNTMKAQGKLNEAASTLDEAVSRSKGILGDEDIVTLEASINLASIVRDQGQIIKAVSMLEVTIGTCRRVLGHKHNLTIAATAELATAYSYQGRLKDATLMRQEVFEMWRDTSGMDHPNTIMAMGQVAESLRSQGQLVESAAIFEDALARCQHIFGDLHPETMAIAGNFTSTLYEQGKVSDVISIQRKIISKRQQAPDLNHLDLLGSMENLALALQAGKSDIEEAAQIQREVLQKRVLLLGENHQDTILAMHNLAAMLYSRNDLQGAASVQEEALKRLERNYEKGHPHLVAAMINLSIILRALGKSLDAQGKSEEMYSLCQKALDMSERTMGPNHPHTIAAMSALAYSIKGQKKYNEALQIERQVIEKQREIYSEDHPLVIRAHINLAATLREMGMATDAVSTLREALAIGRRALGATHECTFTALLSLARTLGGLGNARESTSLYREALEIHRKTQKDSHAERAELLCKLAGSLVTQRQFDEAISLQREAAECLQRFYGDGHPKTMEAAKLLDEMAQLKAARDASLPYPNGLTFFKIG